jgi:hypothetical protein
MRKSYLAEQRIRQALRANSAKARDGARHGACKAGAQENTSMRSFIVRQPLCFLVMVLGGVITATGLGSVVLGAGAPIIPFFYMELGVYVLLPFLITFAVPEREGGGVALAIGAALPLLAFFAWLQHRLIGNLAAGFGVAAVGAWLVLWAVYQMRRAMPAAPREPSRPERVFAPRKLMRRSA